MQAQELGPQRSSGLGWCPWAPRATLGMSSKRKDHWAWGQDGTWWRHKGAAGTAVCDAVGGGFLDHLEAALTWSPGKCDLHCTPGWQEKKATPRGTTWAPKSCHHQGLPELEDPGALLARPALRRPHQASVSPESALWPLVPGLPPSAAHSLHSALGVSKVCRGEGGGRASGLLRAPR